MWRIVAAAVGIVLVAAACSSSSDGSGSTTAVVPAPTTSAAEAGSGDSDPEGAVGGDGSLVSGTFEIAAASTIGDVPGFHDTVTAAGTAADVSAAAGQILVFRLWDASRPDMVCDSEHPLSGCVTVDWSDFEDRPKVPPGGAFTHRVTIALESGPYDFFLSETGALADVPDQYQPG